MKLYQVGWVEMIKKNLSTKFLLIGVGLNSPSNLNFQHTMRKTSKKILKISWFFFIQKDIAA